MIPPLLSFHETPPGILHTVLVLQHKKDIELGESCSKRGTMKLRRGVEHLPYEGRLRKLGLANMEKGSGYLITTFQCLKVAGRDAGERPFNRNCSDRSGSNGLKLKEGKFSLDIWEK